MKRITTPRTAATTLPLVCGQDGYLPAETQCSPACLNAKLPLPPSVDEIAAMRHGALMG